MDGWHKLQYDVNLAQQRQALVPTPPWNYSNLFSSDLQFTFIANSNSNKPLPVFWIYFLEPVLSLAGLHPPANCPSSPTGNGTLTTAASAKPQQEQEPFSPGSLHQQMNQALWQKSEQTLHLYRSGKRGPGSALEAEAIWNTAAVWLWSVKTLMLSRKLSVRPWDPTLPLQVFWFEKTVL